LQWQVRAGKMFLVNMEEVALFNDEEIKEEIAQRYPL